MLAAARSFTEPPGLYLPALPKSVTPGSSRVTASSRKSGVFPMRSIRLWPSVSPSPDAPSRVSAEFTEDEIAAVLLNPYVMLELKRRDKRNVLAGQKHG